RRAGILIHYRGKSDRGWRNERLSPRTLPTDLTNERNHFNVVLMPKSGGVAHPIAPAPRGLAWDLRVKQCGLLRLGVADPARAYVDIRPARLRDRPDQPSAIRAQSGVPPNYPRQLDPSQPSSPHPGLDSVFPAAVPAEGTGWHSTVRCSLRGRNKRLNRCPYRFRSVSCQMQNLSSTRLDPRPVIAGTR